jgi:hypothetical protein
MPYRMRVRKLLNRPGCHAGAYVLAEVEDSSNLKKDRNGLWPWVDITLVLADCGRAVSYDFNLETASERRNSLHKIDLLVETLSRFRDAMHQEAELAAQRQSLVRGWAARIPRGAGVNNQSVFWFVSCMVCQALRRFSTSLRPRYNKFKSDNLESLFERVRSTGSGERPSFRRASRALNLSSAPRRQSCHVLA